MLSSWSLNKAKIVPTLAGALESIIQMLPDGSVNIATPRKNPLRVGFPIANLKPKTVVCVKKTDGCKWSEKS